jgi:hypothetical protein
MWGWLPGSLPRVGKQLAEAASEMAAGAPEAVAELRALKPPGSWFLD